MLTEGRWWRRKGSNKWNWESSKESCKSRKESEDKSSKNPAHIPRCEHTNAMLIAWDSSKSTVIFTISDTRDAFPMLSRRPNHAGMTSMNPIIHTTLIGMEYTDIRARTIMPTNTVVIMTIQNTSTKDKIDTRTPILTTITTVSITITTTILPPHPAGAPIPVPVQTIGTSIPTWTTTVLDMMTSTTTDRRTRVKVRSRSISMSKNAMLTNSLKEIPSPPTKSLPLNQHHNLNHQCNLKNNQTERLFLKRKSKNWRTFRTPLSQERLKRCKVVRTKRRNSSSKNLLTQWMTINHRLPKRIRNNWSSRDINKRNPKLLNLNQKSKLTNWMNTWEQLRVKYQKLQRSTKNLRKLMTKKTRLSSSWPTLVLKWIRRRRLRANQRISKWTNKGFRNLPKCWRR